MQHGVDIDKRKHSAVKIRNYILLWKAQPYQRARTFYQLQQNPDKLARYLKLKKKTKVGYNTIFAFTFLCVLAVAYFFSQTPTAFEPEVSGDTFELIMASLSGGAFAGAGIFTGLITFWSWHTDSYLKKLTGTRADLETTFPIDMGLDESLFDSAITHTRAQQGLKELFQVARCHHLNRESSGLDNIQINTLIKLVDQCSQFELLSAQAQQHVLQDMHGLAGTITNQGEPARQILQQIS